MKIKFRRKSNAEWALLFAMIMPFLFFVLMDLLGLPALVKYTVDIAWGYLFISILKFRPAFPNDGSRKLAILTIAFFFFALVSFLGNIQSPLYYLWGMRNNVRFFVFFFACIFFINPKSIPHYLDFFDIAFWINFPIVLFQYFVLGYNRDHLGGFFGVEKGCNGYMNIFLMIITAKSLLWYMSGKEPFRICLLKIAASLIISVYAELKVFFIELLIIIVFASAMTKFSMRKLWITVIVSISVVLGVRAIAVVFPIFSGWFQLENIWSTISDDKGYTASGDMNRMTAIAISLNRFLPSLWDKLFGLGLGNCDYAAFSFLTTPFYQAYGSLNYVWFSSAFLLLETGLVGLGLYICFFIYLYFAAKKREKMHPESVLYAQLARIMSVMCVLLVIYNSSLRTEAAFMMYFVLALPFVERRTL